MYEYTQVNYDHEFTKEFPQVGGIESFDAYTREEPLPIRNYSQFGWYVFPFKNGSTPYYTTTQAEQQSLETCFNTDYFKKPFTTNDPILGTKDLLYYGFETGVFCNSPATNASYFWTKKDSQSSIECYCDLQSNCYYSPTCRGWFKSSRSHPDECIFQDIYLYAARDTYGLTICAPLKKSSGEFIGAVCADVIPSYTQERANQGNYIRDMYLSQTERTNYVIADKQDIVSNISFGIIAYSGMKIGTKRASKQCQSRSLITKESLRLIIFRSSTNFPSRSSSSASSHGTI
ncbi:hypothetical protein FGO68_gene136 [Halteria grandinella]|uniref:Uncharacterized protein n=1 Tax=Halteria grandinella TaxID=5974 RepID=A0A8J8SWB1_HALGN|nr:hypothetical protein FGO68_gene136 [Halteria grandinella]